MVKRILLFGIMIVAIFGVDMMEANAFLRVQQMIMVRIDVEPQMTGGWQPLPNLGTYHLIDHNSGEEISNAPVGDDGSAVLMLQFMTNTGQQWHLDVTYSDFMELQKAIDVPTVYVDDFNCSFSFTSRPQLARQKVQIKLLDEEGKPVANGVATTKDNSNINFNKQGLAWARIAAGTALSAAAAWVSQNYSAANLIDISRPPAYDQESPQGYTIVFAK